MGVYGVESVPLLYGFHQLIELFGGLFFIRERLFLYELRVYLSLDQCLDDLVEVGGSPVQPCYGVGDGGFYGLPEGTDPRLALGLLPEEQTEGLPTAVFGRLSPNSPLLSL